MTRFTLPRKDIESIWAFFDGVSTFLGVALSGVVTPDEPFLTQLFARLLSDDDGALFRLDYPLSALRADLERSDARSRIEFKFDTHTHTGSHENQHSGADLGIVFDVVHPMIQVKPRAILLQAKRAFRRKDVFTLQSSFESFNKQQHDLLRAHTERFKCYRSVFYLWYAPVGTAFQSETDSEVMRFVEATHGPDWRRLVRMLDIHGGFSLIGGGPLDTVVGDAWRKTQPATRVSDVRVMPETTRFTIGSLCQSRATSPDTFAFAPLADLLTAGLLREIGHDDDDWVALARGRAVDWPAAESPRTPPRPAPEKPIPPRHTLTISLCSAVKWPLE